MKISGVYKVESTSDVWLVDVVIPSDVGVFDFGEITQACSDLDRDNWQVPYDERLIEDSSEDKRWVFFFHHLDFRKPLQTPLGDVVLPLPLDLPDELSSIVYEPPC